MEAKCVVTHSYHAFKVVKGAINTLQYVAYCISGEKEPQGTFLIT